MYMKVIDDLYVPPKLDEFFVYNKGEDDHCLVINPAGPNWFMTNRSGAFLTEVCDGKTSIGELKSILKTYGVEFNETALFNHFRFLEDIRFFSRGSENAIDLLSHVFLNITSKCNLKCSYCYYNSGYDIYQKSDLSSDVWLDIIDQIHGINKDAIITVSGGEPFLSDNLFNILDRLDYLKLRTRIYTNGTVIRDAEIERIISYDNIDYVQVSLDSVVAEENIRTRTVDPFFVMKSIERLQSRDIPVVVSCTITRFNSNSLSEFVNYCKSNDLKYRFVNLFPASGRAKDQFASLRTDQQELAGKISALDLPGNHNVNVTKGYKRLHKKTVCGLGKLLSISDDATVYPCNHLYMKEFEMGNAALESLSDIVFDSDRFINSVPVDTMTPCKGCPVRYLCGGSCRATAYHEKGRMDVNTYDCEDLKSIILNTLWEQCTGELKAGFVPVLV